MNIMNWLLGFRVKLYASSFDNGMIKTPALAIKIHEGWFGHYKIHKLDIASFLVMAEKLLEHTDTSLPFKYNKMHDETRVDLEFPVWCLPKLQKQVGQVAPILYEHLKKVDALLDASIRKSNMSPELKEHFLNMGALNSYRKLHAKVNNYELAEQPQEVTPKVLH